MTIDPAVLIAFVTALGGLVLLVYRSLVSGAIHPRNLVPREDYEALLEVNDELLVALSGQTQAVKDVGTLVERVITKLNGSQP